MGNYSPSLNVDEYENTSPVGRFKANQFGLYDMGGNVWQWCEDFYDGKSSFRMLRGASWGISFPGRLLSSYRFNLAGAREVEGIAFLSIGTAGLSFSAAHS
ncbi:MAG: SUMF1/EgtB/PvdO family nonheme iron enzyme [Verrucomicrobiota bacterium]